MAPECDRKGVVELTTLINQLNRMEYAINLRKTSAWFEFGRLLFGEAGGDEVEVWLSWSLLVVFPYWIEKSQHTFNMRWDLFNWHSNEVTWV